MNPQRERQKQINNAVKAAKRSIGNSLAKVFTTAYLEAHNNAANHKAVGHALNDYEKKGVIPCWVDEFFVEKGYYQSG